MSQVMSNNHVTRKKIKWRILKSGCSSEISRPPPPVERHRGWGGGRFFPFPGKIQPLSRLGRRRGRWRNLVKRFSRCPLADVRGNYPVRTTHCAASAIRHDDSRRAAAAADASAPPPSTERVRDYDYTYSVITHYNNNKQKLKIRLLSFN